MAFSLEAFLLRYGPLARVLARRWARPPAEAEDLVQEALLALQAALSRDPARFDRLEEARGYFFRSLRNQAARARRRPATEALPREPAAPGPDPEVARVRARQAALERELEDLDDQERELLRLRFLERRTLAAIAAARGVAVSTLHSREKALLARLRRRLERREEASA